MPENEARGRRRDGRQVLDGNPWSGTSRIRWSRAWFRRRLPPRRHRIGGDTRAKLIIASVENDVGWLPHYMYRLDHAYEKFNAITSDPLPMKPSDYIRRQVFATFYDDLVGPAAYKPLGSTNYMWALDFPHTDSTWPESRRIVERDFAGVPDDVKRKIVFGNTAAFYHIN